MDWSEINLEAKTWILPPERAKNDEAHVVPLSPLALDQLWAMSPKRAGLVFTTTGKTPVSGFSKANRTLDEQMLRIMIERLGHSSAEPSLIAIPEWRLTNCDDRGLPVLPDVLQFALMTQCWRKQACSSVFSPGKSPLGECSERSWTSGSSLLEVAQPD